MKKKTTKKKIVKKSVKKTVKKKTAVGKQKVTPKQASFIEPLRAYMEKLSHWIDVVRPALVATVVALAWFGQEQLWARHLGPGLMLWLAAAIIAIPAFLKSMPSPVSAVPEKQQYLIEGIGLAAAVVLAFIVRFYQVTEIPHGYFFDEATNALVGLKMLTQPGYLPVFGPSDAPAPTLYHYLNAVVQFFGGADIMATKFVPVLLGTLTIPMFYFLMRRIVSWPVALAAAFILATMRWHMNFSRINFIGIATPLFAVAAAYFLLRGMETRNRWHMALSGLAVSMGLYTYYASNLVPFVLGPYMVMQLCWEKDFIKNHWRNLLVFLIVSFAVFAPLGHFALTNKHRFFARNGQVLIFNHVPPEDAMKAFWLNVKATLLMFNYFGDTNGRHNIPEVPMIDFLSGLLFGIGLIWSLLHSHRKHVFLILLWFIVAVVPGFLTIEAPQSYRCIGAIIPVAMLITLGLERLWLAANDLASATRIKHWLWIGLAIITGAIGIQNVHAYFTKQATHTACWSEFSAREYGMGMMIRELGEDYHSYISAGSFNYPTIRYLGYPHMEAEPFMMTKDIPSAYEGKRHLNYLLLPIHDGALELLRYYYPGGKEEVHGSPYNFTLFTSYIVTQDELRKNKGLLAVYKDRNGKKTEEVAGQDSFSINFSNSQDKLPIRAKWTGTINMPQWGSYEFTARGLDAAVVIIDGIRVANNALNLAQGLHRIEVKGNVVDSKVPVTLMWKRGAAGLWSVIPGDVLSPRRQVHGLTGEYWRSSDWKGEAPYKRIDPLMSFLGADFPMVAPFSARWTGKIIIPESDTYHFGVLNNEHAWLYIDDQLVVENLNADQYREDEVRLNKGVHKIQIDYRKSIGAYPRLVLYWTKPGGVKEKVPFTVLMPE